MKVTTTTLPGVLVLEPTMFTDARGFLYESFNQLAFNQATGLNETFVQDNISRSGFNVLRGLHYQVQNPQGKLVQVIAGEVFDVAVDLRQSSARFGQWVGITLSAVNRLQVWIPPGFAHGFLVTSACADVLYKTTQYYAPEHDRSVAWNDPSIGIQWPMQGQPVLSEKDSQAGPLSNMEFTLPTAANW